MTKRLAALALLALVIAPPAFAGFREVANAIDSHRGVSRVWIPFLGLARMIVRVAEPEGVHDFQLATFEGADNIDPRELHDILRAKAGAGFVPLVRVWSRKSSEWSFIYARPHGKRVELMVLTHDDEDTVLVRVDVDLEKIAKEIEDNPRSVTHVARR